MRTSSGTPPENGCVLVSSRPASKSKPSRRTMRSHSARWASSAKGPTGSITTACDWRSITRWIRPGSHWRTCAEHAVDHGAGHARFEAVHQRVVLAEPGLLRQQRRLFAGDRQHRLPVLDEAGPVVGRAQRAPGMLAARAGQLAALHQLGRAARWRCASRAGSRAGWRAAAPTAVPARHARCARPAWCRCACGASARPAPPAPQRAPRCPWAACSRPGPTRRSTPDAGSGAAACSARPDRRRSASCHAGCLV